MAKRPGAGTARLLLGGAIAAGGALVALGAGTVAAVARSRELAARLRPARDAVETAVLAVDGERIRLTATDEALCPGIYSFWTDDGGAHTVVGRVLARGVGWVERELRSAAPPVGARGRFNGWVLLRPEDTGLPWTEERVQTTIGGAPAWYFPPATPSNRWAVLVHGRGSVRQEALRGVQVCHEAGLNVLLVSYRNDGEAPAFLDERYEAREIDWLDIESAMLHALDRGGRELVLLAWSTGARVALRTAIVSRLASVVTGVVLDSPDLPDVSEPVRRGHRVSVDRVDHDPLDAVDRLAVPVLVLRGDDDRVASAAAIERLARAKPELVRVVAVPHARHGRTWNVDPEAWHSTVRDWLRQHTAERGTAALGSAGPQAAARRNRE